MQHENPCNLNWLTSENINIVGPRTSLPVSASSWSSIFSVRQVSGFSRSTPAAILESEHRVASLWGSQSTFLQSVASSSVVSSQETAPSFQGMNGSSSCVFEASNALNLNRRFSKKDVLKLNFKFPGRNGWGRRVENKLHSHTMTHFLGEESIFQAHFKFQRAFGVTFRGDNDGVSNVIEICFVKNCTEQKTDRVNGL